VRIARRSITPYITGLLAIVAIGAVSFYLDAISSSPATTLPPVSKPEVSEVKKTAEQKSAYSVPAAHPRELIIDKIGVNANIVPVGILKDGSLGAPGTAWDVGWYSKSSLPGTGSGALLIDGHVNDTLNHPGIFYSISTLQAGDEIKLERGDRQVFTYAVIKVERKPVEQVDMSSMLHSYESNKEGLNLITCGGTYNYQNKTYNDRILVYATRSL